MAEVPAQRIAIAVDPGAPLGLLGNAIGVVAVGLGAAHPALGAAPLQDRTGRAFRASAMVALPVLQASPAQLLALLDASLAAEGLSAVVAFPQFARTIHDFPSYRAALQDRDLAHEALAAVGLAGPADSVRRLTRGLALLR